jgi:hypothetical protein
MERVAKAARFCFPQFLSVWQQLPGNDFDVAKVLLPVLATGFDFKPSCCQLSI